MARTKRSTRTAARAVKATGRIDQIKARALATVEVARDRTAVAVSQLEKMFQERVGRTISGLGVPGNKDVRALTRQVAQLQQSVEQLRRTRARA